MLATAFLAIRTVHVVQGATCLVSGRRAYRRPTLAAALEAAAVVELVGVGWRVVRSGRYAAPLARADSAFGLLGLCALSAAMEPADRTASLNWMLPLSVGSCLGTAVGEDAGEGVALSAALGLTYAATTRSALRRGGGPAATAAANALSYPAFFAAGLLVVRQARRMAQAVDEARQTAVEQGARLAAEAARNREHRLLHDSALQTLEAVGRGALTEPDKIRQHARREAAVLRRALSGYPVAPDSLLARLDSLATEFAEHDLRVEVVADELTAQPSPATTDVLCDAGREALANVVKHAGVSKCVLRLTESPGGWTVTVRDRGCGFDPAETPRGFGLNHSISARLSEIGGSGRVVSAPGEGTRVELWVPS